MIRFIYRMYERIYKKIFFHLSHHLTAFYFRNNGIIWKNFTSIGVPLLDIKKSSVVQFGVDLVLVNKDKFATLGKNNRCKFVVAENAQLIVGDKVAMSNATIVATKAITLGNNIMIGGGVTIVDSDFHSLNPEHWHSSKDEANMKSETVTIHDNVFIGMDSIILKGVTIGSNSVIAAGSVVSRDIPFNQIWGGNPAKFIRQNNLI
ncbi:acyltransferase [Flavobacterium sp. WC2421]|jgi:acetyltransferase-like isoleucine patch superfamily enzyme|uniref:DapH/DapD/GlmU-related protein n=1 Tax=Flavobacterium sp. WC2409 TaxID=3234139 RepID=A0AB39W4V2_9FLAO